MLRRGAGQRCLCGAMSGEVRPASCTLRHCRAGGAGPGPLRDSHSVKSPGFSLSRGCSNTNQTQLLPAVPLCLRRVELQQWLPKPA